jgi:hypothetical protein
MDSPPAVLLPMVMTCLRYTLLDIENSPARQRTEVLEDQAEVAHAAKAVMAEAVRSADAKLSPETVTDAEPEGGKLPCDEDSTGASKVTPIAPVPATAATVTNEMSMECCPSFVAAQLTVVDDVHALLAHRKAPSPMEFVVSETPKLRPDTVIVVLEQVAMFACCAECTGPSKENDPIEPVPQTAPTVTSSPVVTATWAPYPDPQTTLVPDVHALV